MYCRNCGSQLAEGRAEACAKCGTKRGAGTGFCPNCGIPVSKENAYCGSCGAVLNIANAVKRKSRMAAGFMGIFFGCFGVHNFYLGYKWKAIVQFMLTVLGLLFSCNGGFLWLIWAPVVVGIWGIVEGILLLGGMIRVDGEGNLLRE